MSWDTIIGQQKVKTLLDEQIHSGKVSHAYLFVGSEGVGKKSVAEILAKALNCTNATNRPCNECTSCNKIDHGNNPNVSMLASNGKKIKIESIRELCKHINLKLEVDSAQVFIIDGADKMTAEAANNLLKTLEEPPAKTHFILLAEEKSAVLPTILSRCQIVFFTPLDCLEIGKYLENIHGLPKDKAITLAKIAQGSLGLAQKIALDEEFNLLRVKAQEIFDFKARDAYDILELSKNLDDNKEDVLNILEILRLYIRDALVIKIGSPELIINKDKEHMFIDNQATIEQLLNQYQLIDECINRLKINANRRLAFDTWLLAWKLDWRKPA